MIKIFFVIAGFLVSFCFSKPMESLTNYNVIMVHGAADNVANGFECEDAATDAYALL